LEQGVAPFFMSIRHLKPFQQLYPLEVHIHNKCCPTWLSDSIYISKFTSI